jgi:hypothetical protein
MPFLMSAGRRWMHGEAYGLRNRHWYEPDDLAALLVFASDKAQERGFKYVERTVRAACSSA